MLPPEFLPGDSTAGHRPDSKVLYTRSKTASYQGHSGHIGDTQCLTCKMISQPCCFISTLAPRLFTARDRCDTTHLRARRACCFWLIPPPFFKQILLKKRQHVNRRLHTVWTQKVSHCSLMQRTCDNATASTLLTCCWTKSLPIGDTIHLHFLSWLGDRGFHHVSLLVHEETQRNHPAVWETHQSPSACPALTGRRRDNRNPVRP